MDFKKVCVIGLGYIGLPTASTLANSSIEVVGVDRNPEIIATLSQGKVHIFEPGLDEVVHSAVVSGKLRVSLEVEPADAFIIAVPTPFLEDKRADMSYVLAAAESIVPHLRAGNLVILESTSPPRTTIDLVQPVLEQSGLRAGSDFHLCYSPERVLPGQIMKELVENARVIGGTTPQAAEYGKALYSRFVKGEIFITDAATAEMVKLMENTYRDINIAIANEFSRLADRFGINIWEAIAIANKHPRVRILNPGTGVGGHCISVDPWFFVEKAPDLTTLIKAARDVNDSQPAFVLSLAQRALGGDLRGKSIGVLGLSFKADVDDFRESPAVTVLEALTAAGAKVKAHEPYLNEGKHLNISNHSLADAIAGADLILLLVNHKAFRELKPRDISAMTDCRLILDAVNAWQEEEWQQAGFTVLKLGKS